MSEFKPTERQLQTLMILVDLIGFTGVHKRPEQDDCMILDLLPAMHMPFAAPFCVKIDPEGWMQVIGDEEAGIEERPSPYEYMQQMAKETLGRLGEIQAED